MAQSIKEVMTHDPIALDTSSTVTEAAKQMRDNDTGAIIVTENGSVAGIVTDRDITVRAVAEGQDPDSCKLGQVATQSTITLTPDQSVDDAIQLVREHDIRRVPVVQDGRPVGIVSIGDLAIVRDEGSALADMSSAPQNN